MCSLFHNDVAGGERFFEFLTHFEREPGRYGDVLELMYLCLSLGFEGRLRVADQNDAGHERLSGDLGGLAGHGTHGPTPPRRSTVMRVTYPGGGLSMGGNLTPGPR